MAPLRLGVFVDIRLYGFSVLHSNKMELDAVFFENLFEKTVAAPVKIVGRYYLVTGVQQLDHSVHCRQTAGKSQAVLAIFYAGQGIFQCGSRRVAASGVFIALMAARGGLGIGRGLINRGHYCAICGIRLLTSMNSFAIEF